MKRIIALILLICLRSFAADWSIHIDCPLEVKQPYNLKELNWSQGQTPLMAFDVTRKGRPEAVDTNAIVRMIIGPSATNDYFVVVTNYLATTSTYYVQMPTIGTNTTEGVWWYTVYFEIDGYRYWSGNGDLYIEETTSTEDGLVWQEITSNGGILSNSTAIAANTAAITAVSNQVVAPDCAVTNVQSQVTANSLTGGLNTAAISAEAITRAAIDTIISNLVVSAQATADINTADITAVSNQVVELDCAVTNVSISAILISNKTYTITITK